MNTKIDFKNYPELKAFLEGSNETQATFHNLAKILMNELADYDAKNPFYMLDVGCSDGELTLPLINELRKQFTYFILTAIEPEEPAFQKFLGKIKYKNFIETENQTIQEFIRRNKGKKEIFDLILYSQCWYHFPKEEWDFIFNNSSSFLKKNGLIIIVLDSHKGDVYKLKDIITKGKADTLEYGDLYSAENVENFLNNLNIKYSTVSFQIYVHIKDNDKKIKIFARYLAFLYRTFPYKILLKHKHRLEKFLKENQQKEGYFIGNLIKAIIIRK